MRTLMLVAAGALPALVAAGSAEPSPVSAGERAYQKCYSCHSLRPGRNELEGPNLYRVVGRRVAAERDFEYSPALKRFAQRHPVWTEELIERFAADPEALVPGTSMAFAGIRNAGERAALIDHLRTAEAPSR